MSRFHQSRQPTRAGHVCSESIRSWTSTTHMCGAFCVTYSCRTAQYVLITDPYLLNKHSLPYSFTITATPQSAVAIRHVQTSGWHMRTASGACNTVQRTCWALLSMSAWVDTIHDQPRGDCFYERSSHNLLIAKNAIRLLTF